MLGFVLRWAFAFILLALTFNPTSFSYVKWAQSSYSSHLPLVVLFGLLLSVGYIIYLRATLRSIGLFGMCLILAIVAALLWVLYDWGLLSLANSNMLTWIGLLALSIVLGIGLSWSHVRRALSGQSDVDDLDE